MLLNTFGRRLKLLRMDRGLSQVDLRDELKKHGIDIGETYISELERTTKMPSLEVAAAMAKALNITLDYLGLLIDEPDRSYKKEPEKIYISPEADTVAQLVDGLSQENRAMVINLARALVSSSTNRQLREDEATSILESIERAHGRKVREDIEQIWRNKGLFINRDS